MQHHKIRIRAAFQVLTISNDFYMKDRDEHSLVRKKPKDQGLRILEFNDLTYLSGNSLAFQLSLLQNKNGEAPH